ncbi:hypothetical protein SU69_05115 [Thermosipho melanesiensis]|uniref:DUF5317 domain-containing protein n=2 Tax=Thermosipho melanesiensis TaxID=46541 RepID=A6LLQ9_THEM4|nr:DUF5317 family protein [Thermosipho melanesiensis]ABR30860.1 hypothetical protein Tmel_0999 [Thermosipho melanesiensis BI429]APT73979.1 hypothetical protein BW47_05355 [Thermosipho melanesiensis]OOC35912.1 hypothetical protein SU68_05170 [Thermosipho melanesiensis]OOC38414.1 hypothetical protein SU69_05115 [Thermosipho melanesiensis]OOC38875.1 hypothetical protein SU70_05115 [Thermosipho melanesiensis]
MILYIFLIAFFMSLITKRIIKVIGRSYKYFYLFPVPFILQVIPYYREILMPFSFSFLIILLLLNKHVPGFSLITIGTVLNSFAMMLYNWRMPVLKSLAEKFALPVGMRHVLVDKFNWSLFFGDWIPVVLPWKEYYIISIGDIFVYIGVFCFLLKVNKKT